MPVRHTPCDRHQVAPGAGRVVPGVSQNGCDGKRNRAYLAERIDQVRPERPGTPERTRRPGGAERSDYEPAGSFFSSPDDGASPEMIGISLVANSFAQSDCANSDDSSL